MAAQYTLVIGNKNLSSWSLRAWLVMKVAGIAFEEVVVRLDQPETRAGIGQYSPAGKVPVLKIAENGQTLTVWDTLAICETVAERHPEAGLWPADAGLRALARAYAAEMHAGFPDVRANLSMYFARSLPLPELNEATKAQVARIIAAWETALDAHGGPFLFGRFSIADGMYAPVVSRFLTYGITLPSAVAAYCRVMMELPALKEWRSEAEAEIERGWK
jgi:glutathione S-transferase